MTLTKAAPAPELKDGPYKLVKIDDPRSSRTHIVEEVKGIVLPAIGAAATTVNDALKSLVVNAAPAVTSETVQKSRQTVEGALHVNGEVLKLLALQHASTLDTLHQLERTGAGNPRNLAVAAKAEEYMLKKLGSRQGELTEALSAGDELSAKSSALKGKADTRLANGNRPLGEALNDYAQRNLERANFVLKTAAAKPINVEEA